MKFVTASPPPTDDDPRQAIVLEGIDAQFTSGSLVRNRVVASKGTLFEGQGILVLEKPRIEAKQSETTVATETHATTAVFYLAESKRAKHQKGDMVMVGNVRYIVPARNDPTTASVIVETENLAWRAANQVFEANSFYRMVLNVPGKSPFVAVGDAFVASRDLRHWNVKYGGLATYAAAGDFRAANLARRAALEAEVPLEPPVNEKLDSAAKTNPDTFSEQPPPSLDVTTTNPLVRPDGRRLHRIPTLGAQ